MTLMHLITLVLMGYTIGTLWQIFKAKPENMTPAVLLSIWLMLVGPYVLSK